MPGDLFSRLEEKQKLLALKPATGGAGRIYNFGEPSHLQRNKWNQARPINANHNGVKRSADVNQPEKRNERCC